jgi:glycine/D-amino acid oxidase-like deaminating enzyme
MSGPGPAAPAAPAEPAEPATPAERQVDVLIVGGGLAGLALARQLLLREGGPRVLLADRRALPPRRQKVGEATVQVSGYYFSRVLEMEEHLLRSHFLKYNLRFYWPSAAGEAGAAGAGARGAGAPGRGRADRYEELSQSYIRNISNIATYQLDRNLFEAELLRVNLRSDRFELCARPKTCRSRSPRPRTARAARAARAKGAASTPSGSAMPAGRSPGGRPGSWTPRGAAASSPAVAASPPRAPSATAPPSAGWTASSTSSA